MQLASRRDAHRQRHRPAWVPRVRPSASLELAACGGRVRERPFREDPQLDLIRRRGYDHEQRIIERLRAEGRSVHEIETRDASTPDELRAAQDETLAAMRRGEDVIFQATFFDGRWRGHADFLLRRDDRPSLLGCVELRRGRHQARPSRQGGRDHPDVRLRATCSSGCRASRRSRSRSSRAMASCTPMPSRTTPRTTGRRRRRFEERVLDDGPAPDTYPEPVDHCRVCSWWSVCMDQRRADDHLSLVANPRRAHRRRLVEAGVPTLDGPGRPPIPTRPSQHVPPRIAERLRRQAALQLGFRTTGELRYELIRPDPEQPGKGLAALPEPSPLDVFFDIESDPWALEDGLEYLFGLRRRGRDGDALFTARSGPTIGPARRQAFEAFVDSRHGAACRGSRNACLSLRRLRVRRAEAADAATRHARGRGRPSSCAGGSSSNLYDHVVRQGIRASVESLFDQEAREVLHAGAGGPRHASAGFSRRRVRALDGDARARDPRRDRGLQPRRLHLDAARCATGSRNAGSRLRRSTRTGSCRARPPSTGAPSEQVADDQAETAATRGRAARGLAVDRLERGETQQARWLLASLLDWHRREAKPRVVGCGSGCATHRPEDLVRSADALGRAAVRARRAGRSSSRVDPPLPLRSCAGDKGQGAVTSPSMSATGKRRRRSHRTSTTIAGTIDLKRTGQQPHPVRRSIPSAPLGTEPMRGALGRVADQVDRARPRRARPLPGRRATSSSVARRGSCGIREGSALAAGRDVPWRQPAAGALASTTPVLPIQGPPGTGKTYTGARMILDLVAAGKRVGITAQSHKAIAQHPGARSRRRRRGGRHRPDRPEARDDDGGRPARRGVSRIGDERGGSRRSAPGPARCVGGTSWLWAREDMEASRRRAVRRRGRAALRSPTPSRSAPRRRSLVLLGDPNQLPQVSQGTHPEGAAASRPRAPRRDGDDDRAGSRPPPGDDLPPPSGRQRVHLRRRSMTGASDPIRPMRARTLATGTPRRRDGHPVRPARHVRACATGRAEEAAVDRGGRRRPRRTAWTDRDGQAADARRSATCSSSRRTTRRWPRSHARWSARLGMRRERRHGRQVPGPGGAHRDLLDDHVVSPTTRPGTWSSSTRGNRLNVAVSRARGLAVLVA